MLDANLGSFISDGGDELVSSDVGVWSETRWCWSRIIVTRIRLFLGFSIKLGGRLESILIRSDNVLFFHRKMGKFWTVFRYVISGSLITFSRITSVGIDAITPAAIDATKVSIVTIRPNLASSCDETTKDLQYRHIEIFDWTKIGSPVELTRGIRPDADHFNPLFIRDMDGDTRIGYHRCRSDKLDQIWCQGDASNGCSGRKRHCIEFVSYNQQADFRDFGDLICQGRLLLLSKGGGMTSSCF